MAQRGTAQLRETALNTLRSQGYRPTWGTLDGYRGRSVHRIEKDGKQSWFLIQTRHNQPETDRYLVGLIVDALNRVDNVALFFEGEELLIISASFLREIHEKHKEMGDASYTGSHDEQWRVDFFLSAGELSPQGSNGRRYNIASRGTRVSV